MFIRQLYTNCLSAAAYYIESEGEAVVIDPLRDIGEYLELAAAQKATIRYIFETHFHADFISGHLDLSRATGAPIVFGPGTDTSYPIHQARDGERFRIGKLELEVLHTPGHTPESCCYLLRNEQGRPYALFSGDTLFVGDVGRPDLSSGRLSKEELAGFLYDSLQSKVLTLPDEVILYPAHGPGTACGKQLAPETQSTIGQQKELNYALQASDKAGFIRLVTEGLDTVPQYFPVNARINKEGYGPMEELVQKGLRAIPPADFATQLSEGKVLVLDTRSTDTFVQGFVPGAISIGLEGRYAEWGASLLPFDMPLLLVTEPGREEESLIRLARVGFEKIEGYLAGGFDAWRESGHPVDMIIDVEADELAMDFPHDPRLVVLDVRKPAEFAEGHIAGALNLPLSDLNDPASMASLEENQNLYLHCAGGYRSVIAASLLKRQGIHNLRNIRGGWKAIREQESLPVEKEPSLLN